MSDTRNQIYKIVPKSSGKRIHLVAAEDIPARKEIIRENPVAFGQNFESNKRLCFSCAIPLLEEEPRYTCPDCKIAEFCDAKCPVTSQFHTSLECNMFIKNKDALKELPIHKLLLILRLLLVKSSNPILWKKVINMNGLLENRARQEFMWNQVQCNVVNPIKKLSIPGHPELSDGIIHILCSIAQMNAFSRKYPGTNNKPIFLHGIYPDINMIAHNCIPNTYMTMDANFHLIIFASVKIEKNEPIFVNYIPDVIMDTVNRREFLAAARGFECRCPLCIDPSELGTHLGSLKCPRCTMGNVIRNIGTYSFEKNSIWKCQECLHEYGGFLVETLYKICENIVSSCVNSDRENLEKVYNRLSLSLHPNNAAFCYLKVELIDKYTNEINDFTSGKHIGRILEMIKEVSDVMDIIQPGMSYIKGLMLYYNYSVKNKQLERSLKREEINHDQHVMRTQEIINILKESAANMLLQPMDSKPSGGTEDIMSILNEQIDILQKLKEKPQK